MALESPMGNENGLISAYGGSLIDLAAGKEERSQLLETVKGLRSLQLTQRSLCDVELLASGVFSPLDRFMSKSSYGRVLEEMRLEGGMLFPIPITLAVPDLQGIGLDQEIVLRSPHNVPIAWMRVEDIYERDPEAEVRQVWGTPLAQLPFADELGARARYCLSGPLKVLEGPRHFDFPELRRTPAAVRRILRQLGNRNVIAFQPNGLMNRAEEELTKSAAAKVNATLLIHALVSAVKQGDVDHYTRIRAYRALAEKYYDPAKTLLNLSPLTHPVGSPRAVIWQSIVVRNYGANHLLTVRGRDGVYGDQATRERAILLQGDYADELGVQVVETDEMVYLARENRYGPADAVADRGETLSISMADVRDKYLFAGNPLPEWFTRKEVGEILAGAFPPRHKQGVCVWFTGLPSAGKSTVAEILTVLLMERGRQVTVLDGDVVRTHLTKGLGFSKADRDTNILRIGFVASEIVRHHCTAVCAAVSPYRATRNQVRAMMREGAFVEVFVDTPVEVCEQRDVKGFYAKARAGEIKGFTGVDDPYEPPFHPEIRLETTELAPADNAQLIVKYLTEKGFLVEEGAAGWAANGEPQRTDVAAEPAVAGRN